MMGLGVTAVPPPAVISDRPVVNPSRPRTATPTGGQVIPFTATGRATPRVPSGGALAPRDQGHETLMGIPALSSSHGAPAPAIATSPQPWGAPADAGPHAATWPGAESAPRVQATTEPGFGVAASWSEAHAHAAQAPASSAPSPYAAHAAAAPHVEPVQASPDRAYERPSFTDARPRHAVTYDERVAWAKPAEKPKRSLLVPMIVAAVALLALVGGAAGAYLAHRATESRVRAHVATVGGFDALVVEVPRADYGARVRFQGRDVPLVAARAVVPLGDTRLAVGENRLALGLVDGDGVAEEVPLDVTVAYRIRPDLSGLTSEPPRFRVEVEAIPGTLVELAGQALALDAQGRGHRDFPLHARALGNVLTERVPYRVLPEGGVPESGEVVARIPIATLELDRPGSALVTDAPNVAIEGAAHSTATVTVNGAPVPVRDGRFAHVLALPEVGEHEITVVARQAGHAPDRESITVRRVANLAEEARSYEVDPTLTYARIAADPAGHRGKRVALDGIVYNVEVHRGESMLQVLASRCGEARCPVWVTYPAATDVQLNHAVRVLGEVDGEQRFRTTGPNEQILTVPRIRAVYVLPLTQ